MRCSAMQCDAVQCSTVVPPGLGVLHGDEERSGAVSMLEFSYARSSVRESVWRGTMCVLCVVCGLYRRSR